MTTPTATAYAALLAASTDPHMSPAIREYLVQVLRERRELVAALRSASLALRSYQYGNNEPDLAESVADVADAALTKAQL